MKLGSTFGPMATSRHQ